MSAKELLSKFKPLIIIILLFSLVFFIRAEAVSINGVPDQKSFYQDQNGLPYFSEMDSYYNFRLTQDLIDHGYLGDTKINGTQWDLHSSFPQGKNAEYPPLIAYLTALFYKFVNLFAQVPLTTVSFWTGAFISSLAVIPAYLFVRRITNDYGGITAGLLIGLAPSYFAHTFAGFFDTDMFNILFPILVIWFFSESILAKDMRNKTIFAVLSAFSMLLFSLAWQGWWYVFYLVIATVVVYLLVSKYLFNIKNTNLPENNMGKFGGKFGWFSDKPEIFSLSLFIVLSLVLIGISLGVMGLFSALTEAINVNQLQAAVQATSYPNVYISVSELQIPSIPEIIQGVGGYAPFFFGFFGVFALIWKLKPASENKEKKVKKTRKPRRRGRSQRRKVEESATEADKKIVIPDMISEKGKYIFYSVLFSLWILMIAYFLTKGVRFIEPFSIPIGLSAGIFVGFLFGYVKDHVANQSYRTIAMAIVIIVVASAPVISAYSISNSVVPGTDDSMVSSMLWIKNNTSNNTVITSWWDYGHLFAAVADRPVTFDGSSQNSPRAYWVGKALLTSNETLSAGILRMLASSGDLAPLTLDNYTKDSGKSAEILNNILGVDKAAALSIMTTNYGLTQEQAQSIVQYTHPDNPTPHVFITSSDMIGKAGWWSYFGSWNFTSNNGTNYQYLAAPMNSTTVNNKTLLVGGNAVVAQANGSTLSAGIVNTNAIKTNNTNLTINQISNELQTGNGTLIIKPHKLILINNNTVTQQIVSNSSQYSIIIINENNSYIAVAMNKELEDSMFTRLFFMGGAGLTQFKPLYGQPGVMVWGVN